MNCDDARNWRGLGGRQISLDYCFGQLCQLDWMCQLDWISSFSLSLGSWQAVIARLLVVHTGLRWFTDIHTDVSSVNCVIANNFYEVLMTDCFSNNVLSQHFTNYPSPQMAVYVL